MATNLVIISCGRVRERYILDGEQEYLKRFPSDFPVEVRETKGTLDKIDDIQQLVLLDERGTLMNTSEFAADISVRRDDGVKSIGFAIGPAEGWSDEDRAKAHRTLSLSPLTFPFQMTRLILIEQIYRAYTLIRGLPYHK